MELQCIIYDLPAKAYLKQIKGHNYFAACDLCEIRGTYEGCTMTFLEVNCDSCAEASFRAQSDEEHHNGDSPFLELQIDISIFAIEYMHCVSGCNVEID